MNPQLIVMTQIRGGVFTRADARACGYPDRDIDTLLTTGGWRRISPGTYAPGQLLPVTDETTHLRRLHHLLRYGDPGLVASHQSAVCLYGLPAWGLDLSRLHVTAATGRPGRHQGGLTLHVAGLPKPRRWNGLRVVSLARAVAEIAATASLQPALVVTEAALWGGRATRASIGAAARRFEAGQARRIRRVLARASPHSGSLAESRLRSVLVEAGLPAPSAERPPPMDGFLPGSEEGTTAVWFPEQRTVFEFEPWLRYWRPGDGDDLAGLSYLPALSYDAAGPPPVEYGWIDWPELDQPEELAERIRRTFARAAARSGVRVFDPSRPRPIRRRPRPPTPYEDTDCTC
ncbi:type IV toxin-antitoxin system AbiEi family antitoxin domain-containing protein [Kribbella deserti]|uniref:Type IV toxin-antitoxin system AbiEi family antitoxin domain-containing protein n=1 Tax=Kribbella deserti TaxID=1926257 RepID=A0ABV6QRD9_9ACTN